MKHEFYITAPIYYVNDRPHIGHAYTTIVADMIARSRRAKGEEVMFSTGTDENSQKTIDAAAKAGEEVVSYTDRMAGVWDRVWRDLGISHTRFMRTTEAVHQATVYEIWKRIEDRGDIYEGTYEGLYCVGHEAFMKESDLVDGLCLDHQKAPEKIKEENYFFRLSNYQKPLLDLYAARPDFIMPESRFHEIKKFVEGGLEDISISRPSKGWGIPVPNNPSHTIYVWFEALINYISAIGLENWERHPADLHTVGKDITRFHAVIWPAMLMSAGLPLPAQIGANGFFTIDGVKISKSLGNAIDPLTLAVKYGNDALRYFLLREIPYGEDGDFSFAKFGARYEGDLANGLGNYAARVLTLGAKIGLFSNRGLDPKIAEAVETAHQSVARHMEAFKFHEALAAIWQLIGFGDAYVNETKPWEGEKPHEVYNAIVILDNVAALLVPFLPSAAEAITKAIAWQSPEKLSVSKIAILFPRLGDRG